MPNTTVSVNEFKLNQLGVSASVVYFTCNEGIGYVNTKGYIALILEDKENRCNTINFGKLLPRTFSKGHLREDADFEVGVHNIHILKIFPASSVHDNIVKQFDKKMQEAWDEVDQNIQDTYDGWHDWATDRMKREGLPLRKGEEPTLMELWELPRDPHNPIQN